MGKDIRDPISDILFPLHPAPCTLSPVPCPLSPVPCPLSPLIHIHYKLLSMDSKLGHPTPSV